MEHGPARGYFPEPTKSILVVQPANVERAKATFAHLGFTIVTGARYLGGHVGTVESRDEWVREKVNLWSEGVEALSKVAQSSPHAAFVGLQKSLQSEWMHLQRVVGGIGHHFAPVENSIRTTFLPALLESKEIDDDLRRIFSLPVKHAGIALPNPTTTASHNYSASKKGTVFIKRSVLHGECSCQCSYPTRDTPLPSGITCTISSKQY